MSATAQDLCEFIDASPSPFHVVETVAQRKVLRYLRCHLVQGFLYGKPMPADDLPQLIERASSPPIVLGS